MVSGVYSILCIPTGQRYIGTATHWEKRVIVHLRKLRRGTHGNAKLQAAWQEHGESQFEYRLLEQCAVDTLLASEKYWVAQYDSDTKGFNVAQLGSNGFLKHGMTHSRTYKSWDAMKQRCLNPNDTSYPKYGGAGIKVCKRWLKSFGNFLADMGERPAGATLDRYPNKYGNYQKSNCRWATPGQQQRNLRGNIYATYQGVTKLAVDWANETGIPPGVLRRRISHGIEGPALFAPTYNSFKGVKNADGEMPKRYKVPRGIKFTAHGKALTLSQWAVELGVKRSTLAQRIFRYKIPYKEALTSTLLKKGKSGPRKGRVMITAFGKTQSLTAWSRETGLSLSTIRNRLYKAKLPPEQALNSRS